MTDGHGDDAGDADGDGAADAYRECDVCGDTVPAASYHEHLLKECPGR